MSTMAHGELGDLLERGVELGVIRAAVEAVAAGEGRAVVVEGPAGIGKTALLEGTASGAVLCEAPHARASSRPLGGEANALA